MLERGKTRQADAACTMCEHRKLNNIIAFFFIGTYLFGFFFIGTYLFGFLYLSTVSPPTADAGLENVAPSLIMVGGVSLPSALQAPYNPFPTSLVPALVALL